MQEPRVILADEPIASLDPLNAKVVMDALADINRRDGITVITNLHTLDTARAYCQRIVGMAEGRVVFDGPPTELTAETVRRIYGAEDDFDERMTSTSLIPQWVPTPEAIAGLTMQAAVCHVRASHPQKNQASSARDRLLGFAERSCALVCPRHWRSMTIRPAGAGGTRSETDVEERFCLPQPPSLRSPAPQPPRKSKTSASAFWAAKTKRIACAISNVMQDKLPAVHRRREGVAVPGGRL